MAALQESQAHSIMYVASWRGDLWPDFLGLGDAFHLPIIVPALGYNK